MWPSSHVKWGRWKVSNLVNVYSPSYQSLRLIKSHTTSMVHGKSTYFVIRNTSLSLTNSITTRLSVISIIKCSYTYILLKVRGRDANDVTGIFKWLICNREPHFKDGSAAIIPTIYIYMQRITSYVYRLVYFIYIGSCETLAYILLYHHK